MKKSMTPIKQVPLGQRLFSSLGLDDMEAECESVESPPSPSRQRSISQNVTRDGLFEENSDDFSLSSMQADIQNRHGKTPPRPVTSRNKTLKPLDLHLSFDNEDDSPILTAAPLTISNQQHHQYYPLYGPQSQRRNKRFQKLAESSRRGESQTPTRLYGGRPLLEADCAMQASPYISPSSYTTMDGRTVTSMNPFSPMITDDHPSNSAAATTGMAPSFPISFETNHSVCASGAPLARHRLQKRHASSWNSPSKRSFLYTSITRDGYPERSGRYSFTGSPIKENEIKTLQNHMDTATSPPVAATAKKIRRLGISDDVKYPNRVEKRNNRLAVDTDLGSSSSPGAEEVSPTDVLSFPTPPTPTKMKKCNSPYDSAEHKNLPETPFLSRSGRRPRRRSDMSTDSAESIGDATINSNIDAEEILQPSRFRSDFEVIGELGKGSFGAVYRVLSKLDGCTYAVKTALRKVKGNADRDRMLKEVYALAALSDQADPATFHIVRYHQAWMEESRLYIQTELCNENLADEIQSSGGHLSADRRYKLLREMLLALEFIHREGNGMCHLDIKPENIFIKRDLPSVDVYKLGDFGLASKIAYHKDVEEGDSRYMSMELLSGDHKDLTKSDIFSLGATLYEISLGRPLPMNGDEWQQIRAGRLQHLPSDTPYDMEMIIREMMNPTYANRPSAHELLKKPQLLSKEQKLLNEERNKVLQAQQALAEQQKQMLQHQGPPPPIPLPGALKRRNTTLF